MAEDAVVTALDGSAAFLMMDDILERLKMLDYELAFRGFTRLTHTYFAMPAPNPNEQFHYFMALCSWLMGLLGSAWQAPSQSDDPNLAAQSLHSQLQQVGAPLSFGGWQKLKQGHGEPCCVILQWLLQQASGQAQRPHARLVVPTPWPAATDPDRVQASPARRRGGV